MNALIRLVLAAILAAIGATVDTPAVRGDSIQITAPDPAPNGVTIPAIGIDLPIVIRAEHLDQTVQSLLDSCQGAVWWHAQDQVMVLAAHRTSCGAAGFAGVETLGTGAVVWLFGDKYTLRGSISGPVGGQTIVDAASIIGDRTRGFLLQTSLSGSTVDFNWMEKP